MKQGISVLLVYIFIVLGCSEDSFLTDVNEIIDNSDKTSIEDIENNIWIYNQMKRHYLWSTELPDSSDLIFDREPTAFFNSLLSDKDRFSWCEINYNYETRGINPGSTVSFDSIYIHHGKKIGYAVYDEFEENADIRGLIVRMKQANIEDLILDLRYNPGGYVSTCCELASFIVEKDHLGKLFQQQYYNNTISNEKAEVNHNLGVDSVFLKGGRWYEMWGLNLKRLFILASEHTASASEAIIIGLRPYMDVIVVGTKTCGKNVGSYTVVDNNYKYLLQPITFRFYNSLMEAVPESGIVPDVMAVDDRRFERGNINEALLKVALQYIDSHPIQD